MAQYACESTSLHGEIWWPTSIRIQHCPGCPGQCSIRHILVAHWITRQQALNPLPNSLSFRCVLDLWLPRASSSSYLISIRTGSNIYLTTTFSSYFLTKLVLQSVHAVSDFLISPKLETHLVNCFSSFSTFRVSCRL